MSSRGDGRGVMVIWGLCRLGADGGGGGEQVNLHCKGSHVSRAQKLW